MYICIACLHFVFVLVHAFWGSDLFLPRPVFYNCGFILCWSKPDVGSSPWVCVIPHPTFYLRCHMSYNGDHPPPIRTSFCGNLMNCPHLLSSFCLINCISPHHSSPCICTQALFPGSKPHTTQRIGWDSLTSVEYAWQTPLPSPPLCQIDAHEDDVNAVAFADSSSQLLFSGSDDALCKMWDRRTLREDHPQPVGQLAGHRDGITFIDSKVKQCAHHYVFKFCLIHFYYLSITRAGFEYLQQFWRWLESLCLALCFHQYTHTYTPILTQTSASCVRIMVKNKLNIRRMLE